MIRNEPEKINWQGTIISIQPRTTVWRYVLDNRTHSEIGYNLFLEGEAEGEQRKFSVAISEKQYRSGDFNIGDEIRGTAWTKMYTVSDYADYYRAGALKKIKESEATETGIAPPWKGALLDLETYSDSKTAMDIPSLYFYASPLW